MKNLLGTKLFFVSNIFLVVVLFCFLSCGDDDNITNGNKGPVKIASGKWTATIGFGTFDFIVNSESSQIMELKLNFDGWEIGNTTHNESITFTYGTSGIPIANRQFTFAKDINFASPVDIITINGTFSESANTAEGEWNANFDGLTDSGNWQASPSG